MSRLVFISYNFKNRELSHTLKNYFQELGGPCEGKPLYVTRDVSEEGAAAIDLEIRAMMDRCTAAIFVIGDDNHNSPWIEREAEIASSRGIAIVAVRLRRTTGALPPKLREMNIQTEDWEPDALCTALNRAAREKAQ
jgi:hypothetical protein